MAISLNKVLGTYEAALKLRVQRAEVLSSNLANVDTPNFKARDFDFQSALSKLEAQQTMSAKGLAPPINTKASVGELHYRTPTQPSVDGNTVDEHLEHAAYMENSLEYQVAFTLLNSRFKGMISAIKGE